VACLATLSGDPLQDIVLEPEADLILCNDFAVGEALSLAEQLSGSELAIQMSIRRLYILTRHCFFGFLYVSLVFLGCDSNFLFKPPWRALWQRRLRRCWRLSSSFMLEMWNCNNWKLSTALALQYLPAIGRGDVVPWPGNARLLIYGLIARLCMSNPFDISRRFAWHKCRLIVGEIVGVIDDYSDPG
jgi:hypothetical protein